VKGLDPADDSWPMSMLRDVRSPPRVSWGGREYAAIAGAPGNPDPLRCRVIRIWRLGAAMPFAGRAEAAPFASRQGEIHGETASPLGWRFASALDVGAH